MRTICRTLAGEEDSVKDEDDEDRFFRRVFERLRKRPDVVRVGTVFVDVPWAVERRVACGDGLCMQNRRGPRLAGKTCCTTFRVPIDERDVERIARVVHKVSKIRDVGQAIDRAGGWWEIQDDGAYLKQRPTGACVFLSAAKGERPWCTIHEWAVNRGMDFRAVKPETCCLFPLYTPEYGDQVLVTSYGSPLMKEFEPGEADDIRRFRCLHPPEKVGVSLIVEQQEELEYRLGRDRWGRMLQRLRKLGHAV